MSQPPTPPDSSPESWVHDLDGFKFAVAGKMGTGKSTFIEQAEEFLKDLDIQPIVEQEQVDQPLLDAYIEESARFAGDFQLERACACHHRQEIVMIKWDVFKSNCVALVERELYENEVFAKANVKMGHISQEWMDDWYSKVLEIKNNYPCDYIIYLHCSDEKSVERQAKRARKSEDKYDMKYIRTLGDCYFDYVMDHCARKKMIVIDWNKFGSAEKVLKIVADVVTGRLKLPTVTRINTSDDEELSSSAGLVKISSKEGDETVAACRPSVRKPAYQDGVIRALANFSDVTEYI